MESEGLFVSLLISTATLLICGSADSRKIIGATLVPHRVAPSCVVSEVTYKRLTTLTEVFFRAFSSVVRQMAG
jgi:hypothetical protein